MKAALNMYAVDKNWNSTTVMANNLSELEMTLGNVTEASYESMHWP